MTGEDWSSSLPTLLIWPATLIVVVNFLFRRGKFERDAKKSSFKDTITGSVSILSNNDSVLRREHVKDSIDGYEKLFKGARNDVGSISSEESIRKRELEYKSMVNSFYDLVTDFYEWGWGQSFHFAPRFVGETFEESIVRAEFYLASRLGVGKGDKVLDIGCGVGGPMRNISRFTGCDVTGITLNEYQVKVANKYCAMQGLDDRCKVFQGDFQDIGDKFKPETYDGAYQIEATCHSPNRREVFRGIAKCLKKGAKFAGYEWVVLPSYDKNNADHVRIKEGIEVGNGLPTLVTEDEIKKALEDSGFEVIDAYNANQGQHSEHEIPWYATLQGGMSLKGFRMTKFGRTCTHALINTLEFTGIAPKGSVAVSSLLNATALDLVEGGEKSLFTPSYFFVARKL